MVKIEHICDKRYAISLNKNGFKETLRIPKQNVLGEFVIYLDDKFISIGEEENCGFCDDPEYPIYVFFYSDYYRMTKSNNLLIKYDLKATKQKKKRQDN